MELAHTKTSQEVLNFYNTDNERGLSLEQVRQNQEKYGPNGTVITYIYCALFLMKNFLIHFRASC